MGLLLEPGREAREWLERYLMQSLPSARVRCVSKVGWFNKCYVLPDTAYGSTDGEEVVYQGSPTAEQQFQVSGTAEDWRENVGRLCAGIPGSFWLFRLPLPGLCCIRWVKNLAACIFAEDHPSAKPQRFTSLLLFGGARRRTSISGGPRPTVLKRLPWLRNDGLLCLDELSQLPPEKPVRRPFCWQTAKRRRAWGKIFWSGEQLAGGCFSYPRGNLASADKIAEEGTGRRTTAGQEVRGSSIFRPTLGLV